jgi:hypothetical protein
MMATFVPTTSRALSMEALLACGCSTVLRPSYPKWPRLPDEQVNGREVFTPERHLVALLESETKAEKGLG